MSDELLVAAIKVVTSFRQLQKSGQIEDKIYFESYVYDLEQLIGEKG